MDEQGSITRWIVDIRDGGSMAATNLWKLYYERLVRLAKQKLGSTPRRVHDEEDVVLGAFDSFVRGAQEGRFPQLADRDDLWQVLVMLTARKASNQLKHDRRQKRGGGLVRGESVFQFNAEERAGIDAIVGSEPTPEFAGEVTEECRRLFDLLNDETLRTVAQYKMEGCTNDEIAAKLGVKTRTIERKLALIREIWTEEGEA